MCDGVKTHHKLELRACTAGRTRTKLIMSNGSERGDYVDCVKMQRGFASPHDGVQLMKTYYPSDPKWSSRTKISRAHLNPASTYAWDHDYDDYWPLDFDVEGGVTERQLEDIKLIGADVHLTLTLDMSLTDEELVEIFEKLSHFGTVYLRINHEANGRWFRHHKLHSRKELSDFFVRCHRLIQCHTPNIKTVFSLSADVFVGNQTNSVVTKGLAHLAQSELQEALGVADYWSLDKYVTLNWGWPHTHPAHSSNYFTGSVDTWWRLIEETYLLMIVANGGVMKPLFLHEFNSDSDVVGERGQATAIAEVYRRLREADLPWLEGICFYQYCDEGGLGLLKGRDGKYSVTESMSAYEEAVRLSTPEIHIADVAWEQAHFSFGWQSSTSIKGVSIGLPRANSHFTNYFDAPVYLVHAGRWNLLSPGEEVPVDGTRVELFVPPAKARGRLRYVTTVHNIDERLSGMFSLNESGRIYA
jgi:hypothetical protein